MNYVIVLNWNGADDTIACLKSLCALKADKLKVVVCDNDSTDDSWVKLEGYANTQSGLDLCLIQTGANYGFAGGNNFGLRLALSDPEMEFVWLLNNDTEVDRGALDALVDHMLRNPDIGICGSTLLYMDKPDTIQAVGGVYNTWLGTSKHVLGHHRYSPELCSDVDPAIFDYVVGASMFVRRSVLEQVGLLAEEYFLYCEEIDWATRMKRQMPELKLGYASSSLVYHKEGASTGSNERQGKAYSYVADYHMISSRAQFAKKFFPIKRWVVQLSMLVVGVKRIKRKQWRSAALALRILFCGSPAKFDPRQSRTIEVKSCVCD